MDEKIVDLENLAEICKDEKADGKKIVLCHGCFDLLHPGHIRHFKAAKKYGDILIVTVTPDKFVNKGPGRPVFNEQLRMESIASLNTVDYVSLNKWDTSIETSKMLKPDFYVKGNDYSDKANDITGNILLEEEAVKECGGELKFTDEITFSSSKIINEMFDVFSKEAKDYIKRIKQNYTSENIIDIVNSLNDLKVCIIGDAILDEYIFCKAIGKPEKAAVVSTKQLYRETYAGGSLAVANHVSNFTDNVQLITCLGKEDSKEDFIKSSLNQNIHPRFFYRGDAPTIVKRRYLEDFNKNKLFETSELNEEFIDKEIEEKIIKYLKTILSEMDMVLVADFGHGLITPNIQTAITNDAKFSAVNAQTNSANFGFNLITKYKNVDYISIDEKELRLPYGNRFGQVEPLVKKLSKDTKCDKINITLGGSGSLYFQNSSEYFVPIFSNHIVDTVGAGDAVLSITSLLAKKEVNPELIPFIGNAAGALAVKVMGNKEPLNPVDLFRFIQYLMK